MALANKGALFLEVWNYFCQIRAERVCFWARRFVTRCGLPVAAALQGKIKTKDNKRIITRE